jgi:hypothetical protein
VNEQWPAYWETIFVEQGFQRLDPLRFRLWHDERVEWWYRQNLFLYASDKAIAESTALCKECERTRSLELTLIHSDVLNRYTSLSGILREVPGALRRAVVRRLPWHR